MKKFITIVGIKKYLKEQEMKYTVEDIKKILEKKEIFEFIKINNKRLTQKE